MFNLTIISVLLLKSYYVNIYYLINIYMNLIKLLIEYYRNKYPYLLLNEIDDIEYIVAI